MSVFPTGDYKMTFAIFKRDKKTQFLFFDLCASVLTSNKDSFGWSTKFSHQNKIPTLKY